MAMPYTKVRINVNREQFKSLVARLEEEEKIIRKPGKREKARDEELHRGIAG
jgi:hypothetical protein